MPAHIAKFQRDHAGFYKALQARANAYFQEHGLTPYATPWMLVHIGFYLILFFGLYGLILSNWFSAPVMLLLAIAMGVAGSLIALNISHDASHGALFRNPRWNRLCAYTFNLIGMNAYTWHYKHNVAHHTFPNVLGWDADIEGEPFFRFAPTTPWCQRHRLQYLYAMPLYLMFSLFYSLLFDFHYISMPRMGNNQNLNEKHPTREYIILYATKLLYFGYLLFLPMWVLQVPWWQVLLAFVILHAAGSLVIALVLTPGHLVAEVEFPEVAPGGDLEHCWAVHQLVTTVEYQPSSKLLNWLTGGSNHQVTHHLFPRVCHIHYPALSKIVQQTAEEFNVPFYSMSWWSMICSHFRFLKQRGQPEPSNLVEETLL